MKKLYTASFLSLLLFSGCDKDMEDRIIGTWKITDVERIGTGTNIPSGLPFKGGSFTFYLDETASYTNEQGLVYQGKYTLERDRNNENGEQKLMISVVHYPTQHLLMDSFDDVNFDGNRRFTGRAVYGSRTYLTEFEK